MGLAQNAAACPYVREISALRVTKTPPEQAAALAERLGLKLPCCLLDREAHRQGLKAQARRSETIAQLYREALQRALNQAEHVLVVADGGLWIWNLAKDRFPDATQRLDLWPADEPLWEAAHDLFGRGTPEQIHLANQPLGATLSPGQILQRTELTSR